MLLLHYLCAAMLYILRQRRFAALTLLIFVTTSLWWFLPSRNTDTQAQLSFTGKRESVHLDKEIYFSQQSFPQQHIFKRTVSIPKSPIRLQENYSKRNFTLTVSPKIHQTKDDFRGEGTVDTSKVNRSLSTPEEILDLRCSCVSKTRESLQESTIKERSTCSDFATARGYGQKVVSYCVFGAFHDRYMTPLLTIATDIKELLPGWIMRVYTDVKELTRNITNHELCFLHCYHEHVDICNVKNLPTVQLKDSELLNKPLMWRFLPMIDPLVDIMLSRDSDSYISERETICVQEWLNSPYTFHSVRDHPGHTDAILAGMWGVKSFLNRKRCRDLGMKVLQSSGTTGKRYDQDILAKVVYADAWNDMLCHASYHCDTEQLRCGKTAPIPEQREGTEYIGAIITDSHFHKQIKAQECPLKCRPPLHPEWKYC